jgi:hypothetical protein
MCSISASRGRQRGPLSSVSEASPLLFVAEDEATAILSAAQQFGLVGHETSLEAHLVTPP